MTERAPVKRDAQWVAREYGREKWPAVAACIDGEIASGEIDLARIVSRVKRRETRSAEQTEDAMVVAGRRMLLPRAFGVHGGLGLIMEQLVSASQECEAIIELGSGWGCNLFNLWLSGGPRSARYYALEYTEAGRRCSERLASLEPGISFTTMHFDYNRVDLSSLGRFAGRVLVFSCFSVDQIPQLSPDVFIALSQLGSTMVGLHFEPAGWQMRGKKCAGSSAEYAERHDYNRNLWPLLNRLQTEKLLRIDAAIPEFFGQNPANSASLLRWSIGE